MKTLKKTNIEILTDSIADYFSIQEYKPIIDFALQDIDLSDDVSAPHSRIDLQHYPYLIQPLSQCAIEKGKRKEVVLALPEQMGKTTLELIAILYNCVYNSLQCIIAYPSLQLAVETSTVKFIPLFRKIKQFQQEIEKPFAIRADRLKLSNAIIYWQGAGTKIVSKSAKLVLGDQCAIWQTPNGINNLAELKKRTRAYNECLQLFVSTASFKQNPFWNEFLEGSQAFFCLRCQGCGQLTLRSCDIHNLQFQTAYNEDLKLYTVVPDSCRLICPKCGHEHKEKDRYNLITQGGYIHKFPELAKTFPTYQAGALASLLNVHSWDNIASAQLKAGKSGQLSDYISFDNSIRGLPYQQREYRKQNEAALSEHYYKDIPRDDIQAVLLAADTQDTFSVVGVFALTKQNNIYLLSLTRPRYLWLDDEQRQIINAENKRNGKPPEVTVLDMLDSEYYGFKPLMCFVDMRGHRADEIKNFSKMKKNIVMYGGTSLKYDLYKKSENVPKLFLCDAKKFQADLIFRLYFAKNKQSGYLYLPESLTEQDIEEITAFQPDNEKRNGNLYENWTPDDKVHDFFDVLKMGIAAFRIASKIFRKERFKFGEAKILNDTPQKRQAPKQAKPIIRKNSIRWQL